MSNNYSKLIINKHIVNSIFLHANAYATKLNIFFFTNILNFILKKIPTKDIVQVLLNPFPVRRLFAYNLVRIMGKCSTSLRIVNIIPTDAQSLPSNSR